MHSPAENILQDLFGTTSLQNVSVEQLRQMIHDHPYDGAAHFLLAKKLYLSKEAGYTEAIQKAALHFSNDLWLHFALNENEGTITEVSGDTLANEALIVEETLNDEELPVEDYTEEAVINEKLSSMLQDQAAAFEKPVGESTEVIVENIPYHRVDYFDSQGIKLEEGKVNDKLGTQLRRFTDWLKQMKRVNPNPVELESDEAGEHQVQNIAEHSNESEDIVTETMAEVLIKQGKPEQAIQIYQKLSFNNRAKSAYFAAKIEELKG